MSNIISSPGAGNQAVQQVELAELPEAGEGGRPLLEGNLDVIKNVRVKLEVMIGGAELSVSELYELQKDSVIRLDRDVEEPVDLVLDGQVVARGTLVVSGDNFGICLTEIAS
ncbi:MAG TPA: flagellar motor switch protein [Gammaproteobacteria bacterium]|nr:flagellar motor switch protein [Gammaproteobacteria bacterium]